MSATTSRADVVKRIEREGVIAIVRLPDAKLGREVANALLAGGISAIEITMTVPRAVELIAELSSAVPQALIGAGTVTDAQTARDVIAAGARYVISPVFRPAVVDACLERDVPVMPGCFSPTEIFSAWEMGVDAVKLFPATALGPTFIKDLRGPFPSLKVVPTGGVSLGNAADWIRAGAMAIGVGSAMVDAKAVQAGRFDILADNARAFAAAVRGAR
jgi:2-dehydro-3-deoxyphosphogluconate aldolase / (4S)-4-hydroxy-2-oxoglutarate aldolase